jgi:hypothetical protein
VNTQARTLAHMRDPHMGARIWAGARQITPGPTRTMQIQANTPEEMRETGMTRQTQLGSDFTPEHYVDTPPYPTKHSTAGFFVSDPGVFQSYFKVHWEDMFGMSADLAGGTRRLSPLANPGVRGSKEGQAIIPYNPWPSGSQLVPEYPGAELKAV